MGENARNISVATRHEERHLGGPTELVFFVTVRPELSSLERDQQRNDRCRRSVGALFERRPPIRTVGSRIPCETWDIDGRTESASELSVGADIRGVYPPNAAQRTVRRAMEAPRGSSPDSCRGLQ